MLDPLQLELEVPGITLWSSITAVLLTFSPALKMFLKLAPGMETGDLGTENIYSKLSGIRVL